jgi:hypothetical protein
MSSLRISQHRGAIGAPASGSADNARAETAGDGASFAGALGSAVVAPGAAPSPGGSTGENSDGATPPRKRGGDTAPQGVDASAILAGVATAAIDASAAVAANGAGSVLSQTPVPDCQTVQTDISPLGDPSPASLSNGQAAQGGIGRLNVLSSVPLATGVGSSVIPGRAAMVDTAIGHSGAAGSAANSLPGFVADAPLLTGDATAGLLSPVVTGARTSGPGVAGNSTASTDPAGLPVSGQRSSGPDAVLVSGVTAPLSPLWNVVPVGSAPSAGFTAAMGNGTLAIGKPGRSMEPDGAPPSRASPAITSAPDTMPPNTAPTALAPTPEVPAIAVMASANPALSPRENLTGAAQPLAMQGSAEVPADLVSNASAGTPTAANGNLLPALAPVASVFAEVSLPAPSMLLVSAADATRDARNPSQPFGAVSDPGTVQPAGGLAPVAGAEISPTAAATSSPDPTPGPATDGVSDQVAAQLVRLVSSGSRDMVMRLRPPELGDVTVRVAVSGREVSAWFASPQPQVQSAISAAIGQLQTSLGDAGYNLSGAWVGGGAANPQQERPSPPTPAVARTPSGSAAVAPIAAAQLPAASGLNIYV